MYFRVLYAVELPKTTYVQINCEFSRVLEYVAALRLRAAKLLPNWLCPGSLIESTGAVAL